MSKTYLENEHLRPLHLDIDSPFDEDECPDSLCLPHLNDDFSFDFLNYSFPPLATNISIDLLNESTYKEVPCVKDIKNVYMFNQYCEDIGEYIIVILCYVRKDCIDNLTNTKFNLVNVFYDNNLCASIRNEDITNLSDPSQVEYMTEIDEEWAVFSVETFVDESHPLKIISDHFELS